MTEQLSTAATEAKNAIEQYKQTNENQEVSRDALETIGCTRHTQEIHTEKNADPIHYYLYRLDTGTWVYAKVLTQLQGDKYTRWYLCGIGDLNVSVPTLNHDSIRDSLENCASWNSDSEQVATEIKREIESIEHWWADDLLDGGLWTVFTDSRLYMTSSIGSPDYHNMPDLNPGEQYQISTARGEAHGALGNGLNMYDYPHTVHYVLDVEFDASTLDVSGLFD